MKKLLTLILPAFALTAGASQTAEAGECRVNDQQSQCVRADGVTRYGAIAFSPEGITAISMGHLSATAAAQDALSTCGRADCWIDRRFTARCAAIASVKVQDDWVMSAGTDESMAGAVAEARAACRREFRKTAAGQAQGNDQAQAQGNDQAYDPEPNRYLKMLEEAENEGNDRDKDIFQLHTKVLDNLLEKWDEEDKAEQQEAPDIFLEMSALYGNEQAQEKMKQAHREWQKRRLQDEEVRRKFDAQMKKEAEEAWRQEREEEARQWSYIREVARREQERKAQQSRSASGPTSFSDAAALWGLDLKKIEKELEQAREREAREQARARTARGQAASGRSGAGGGQGSGGGRTGSGLWYDDCPPHPSGASCGAK